jgi:hypothetical protein
LAAARRHDSGSWPSATRGLAGYARLVFAGGDVQRAWDEAMRRAGESAPDAGALLDLSTLLQLTGQRDEGLALQADALARQRHYRRVVGTGIGPRLLVLAAAGDLMANTPIDFLLGGWSGVVDTLYLAPGEPIPEDVPDHDIALLAIGESDANAALLRSLEGAVAAWPRPTLNGAPASVLALARDRAPALLAGAPGLDAPPSTRLGREALAGLTAGGLADLLPGRSFPILVRPVGSHAGAGLEKLQAADAIAPYLAERPETLFYLTPFVDYRSPDGRYRKLRVALIDGRPFIAHLAVSDHWMVHYLNAGMAEDGAKRAEEAGMMASFENDFAARHAEAFQALHASLRLDYVAIDCAEARDGRLLVFEADTAMILHDMDPPDLFPYKPAAMRRLFKAFQALVARRAGRVV